MLFPNHADAATAAMNLRAKQDADRQRRDAFARRSMLLDGDYRNLVKERVREIFANAEAANRASVMADSSCNVFRFVVTEIAQYRGARRSFVNGATRDPTYARIEADLEPFDLVMQEIATCLRGTNDLLLRVLPGIPGPDGKAGRPTMRVFRPHECTVIPRADDPSQPAVVMYDQLTPAGDTVTVVWTETEHYTVDGAGKMLPASGAFTTENPLGRLPFVAIHASLRPDDFWDESTGTDEVEFTIDYLAGWSAVRHLIHQQSHKQVVVSGVDEDYQPPSKVGPGTIWRMTGQAEIDALDLKSDPIPLVEALERALAGHMATQGLNPSSIGTNPGQTPPSGLSLYLDRQKVIERRRKLHPALVEAEYALAELYRWAWNLTHPPAEQIDPAAEFEVQIIEETVVESPNEAADTRKKQLEVIRQERELGLKSVAEQIAEDRGISLEEAQKVMLTLHARAETFAYDQENGVVTIDEARAGKGLGPHPNPEIGKLTLPELREKFPKRYLAPTSSSTVTE